MPNQQPITVNAPQRSEEWYKARLGKVTASRVADTMAFYKQTKAQAAANIPANELTVRKNYREGIVAERLTGLPADPEPYVNYDMKWGMVNEDIAKTIYQMQNRMIVEEAPLMLHPTLAAGASPDGIATDTATGEVGLVECKCLRSANHLYKVMRDKQVPRDHLPQIQMQMWITGYDWCDFIAFDSRLPEGLKIFVQRVARDDEYLNNILIPGVTRFLAECDNDFKMFWAMVKTDKKGA